ncbi:MAG TPA: 3-phosphoshikimate 1-carboxyvinyltransferase [Solirubrobacteraceae bacterium]|nr:3-phosphoshikimate 1-carboxyvinyltransferase [Solirubrobacteraceae bacterium]
MRLEPPPARPPDCVVRPPGSKSLTNRALLCGALAAGESVLRGALFADDTRAMLGAVAALGARVEAREEAGEVRVAGRRLAGVEAVVDARQSGTTARFVLAALGGGVAECVVDGDQQLRGRPMGPLVEALRALGVSVRELGEPGRLPLAVRGPALGRRVSLPGHVSSQFLSGLLMAGPTLAEGLEVSLSSPLVSVPYVEMTRAVMARFGVEVEGLAVAPGAYRACEIEIEPDASAASYFFAAAAITGGRVAVPGLSRASLQGDVRFVELLERMGARVAWGADAITVEGGELRGIDADMSDISDTAQTLAVVAPFAQGPTRVRGIGFIRAKETDRIAAIVGELRRAGIDAHADDDGFTIVPGTVAPARFATHDDHRMAMSLALLSLRVEGIELDDPGCVAKTYPGYFEDLERLRR